MNFEDRISEERRKQMTRGHCAVGHPITAVFAFHGDHFLFGHHCSVDGRYWAVDPCIGRVVDAQDRDVAMFLLDGSLATPQAWLDRWAP